ncbi:MAG TPA: heavy metal-associated domain-containing protein [Chitinophagales bacterium]|nr:heavy metal-associated domain-containing protein [Chitinophagales bacterium]
MRTIISIVIMLAAIAAANTGIAQTAADTLKTATIKVSGITCNGDMPVIKKRLLNQEGIDEAAFSAAKSGAVTFTVKYHSAIITEKKIREVIEGAPSCDNPSLFPYKVKAFAPDTVKKQ